MKFSELKSVLTLAHWLCVPITFSGKHIFFDDCAVVYNDQSCYFLFYSYFV